MSFGKRIYLARKVRNLTQTGIARALGITPQSVQQWEKGDIMPRRERMTDLANLLQVSINYLEHGMGPEPGPVINTPPHRGESPYQTVVPDKPCRWPAPEDMASIIASRRAPGAPPGATPGTDGHTHANVELVIGTLDGKVPLISWVQAGAWAEAIDTLHPGEAEAWLPCPVSHGPRSFALRVAGDSMTAPYGKSYPEGSVVYVDPEQTGGVTTGDRVIAQMPGENAVTFKSFVEDAGRRYLKPLNTAYPLITEPFRLLGKVILKVEFE